MRLRTIRMTETAYGVFFMIPLKVVISGQGRRTSTAWHRSAIILLISALPRGFPLQGSMVASLQIEVLVALKYQELFMPGGKPDNNFC